MKNAKIKVAHILHSVGGVDVSLRLILGNLDHNHFENFVIHGQTDTNLEFKDQNGKTLPTFQTSISRNINLIKDLKALLDIVQFLKKERPDLIHCHSAKGGILGKISSFFFGIPCFHTPQAYSYLSAENKLKKGLFLGVEKFLSHFNNKILASSNSEKNRAIKEVGYKKNKVLVFSNSILPINNIPKLSIPKTWPDDYICSVGRPSFQKNIELMIEILAKVKNKKPDIHLVLMGVGFHSPNLSIVKELIEKHRLKNNITLLEWTQREDIFNIVAHSKLYISTARYEGLPYSIIESLALSKACVVTDADGNRDLIENKKNGYVLNPNETDSFVDKVLELLQNDKLRDSFGIYSKSKFESEFNILKTIQNLESIYTHEVNSY
ncbi:glycosyltransferase, GTB_type superfamily [Psychroflexus torquis ATCC 700755]|uniref:Glycosyltransferase, GTB_type superfamily n=1 Tax=Psychroflexus torquis (strain ATCC 700755 / CIP 106069 / ACAM 623) TaxID=313595 RepID=K4IE88_PSYTT|nr:glycosyltransferase [Psychroflexus torquis]AFU68882.1 glycosyltransferase, GTB_type superfamily [Psychroflexus torquis ATCC 700755]